MFQAVHGALGLVSPDSANEFQWSFGAYLAFAARDPTYLPLGLGANARLRRGGDHVPHYCIAAERRFGFAVGAIILGEFCHEKETRSEVSQYPDLGQGRT